MSGLCSAPTFELDPAEVHSQEFLSRDACLELLEPKAALGCYYAFSQQEKRLTVNMMQIGNEHGKKRLLVFLHFTKNAGTAVRTLLHSFKGGEHMLQELHTQLVADARATPIYSWAMNVGKVANWLPSVNSFYGEHPDLKTLLSTQIVKSYDPTAVITFTVVRNPADRIYSWWRHFIQPSGVTFHDWVHDLLEGTNGNSGILLYRTQKDILDIGQSPNDDRKYFVAVLRQDKLLEDWTAFCHMFALNEFLVDELPLENVATDAETNERVPSLQEVFNVLFEDHHDLFTRLYAVMEPDLSFQKYDINGLELWFPEESVTFRFPRADDPL